MKKEKVKENDGFESSLWESGLEQQKSGGGYGGFWEIMDYPPSAVPIRGGRRGIINDYPKNTKIMNGDYQF